MLKFDANEKRKGVGSNYPTPFLFLRYALALSSPKAYLLPHWILSFALTWCAKRASQCFQTFVLYSFSECTGNTCSRRTIVFGRKLTTQVLDLRRVYFVLLQFHKVQLKQRKDSRQHLQLLRYNSIRYN